MTAFKFLLAMCVFVPPAAWPQSYPADGPTRTAPRKAKPRVQQAPANMETAPPLRTERRPPRRTGPVRPVENMSEMPEPVQPVVHKISGSSFFTLQLSMWQESIALKNGAAEAKMETQSKGFFIGYDRHSPRAGSRWAWLYGLDVGVGAIKGKGGSPIPDQFASQPFTMGSLRWGLVYRSNPVARFGLVIPVVYRNISWVYEDTSATKAQDKKLSAGVQLLYLTRLSDAIMFQASITHQHMWENTIWASGFGVEF